MQRMTRKEGRSCCTNVQKQVLQRLSMFAHQWQVPLNIDVLKLLEITQLGLLP
jgi:hypothetical protein